MARAEEEILPTLEELGHRLEENRGAVDVTLTADELREIDEASSQITIHGARYGEGSQKMIDR